MRFPKNRSAWNIILVKVILYFVVSFGAVFVLPCCGCVSWGWVLFLCRYPFCWCGIKKRKMLQLFLRVQLVVVFSWIQLHCKMLCIHLTCIYNSIQIQEHRACIYGDVKKKKTKWPSDNTFNYIIMKYLLILCKINKQGFYYFKE